MSLDIPDPLEAPPIRWGIIGAGYIARKFADAITNHTRSEVTVVAARERTRAERFAAANGITRAVTGYQALVGDAEVDAVYVATPHPFHREHALLAMRAGKPVLVEKPFAPDGVAAREMARVAHRERVFAMEAMWTRFLPHMRAVRHLIAEGEIGSLVHVHADYGRRYAFDPHHRIYDPALAGGALLDLGVYPISFVHDMLGRPSSVTAKARMTTTGVDGQTSVLFEYGDRAQATVYTTLWGHSRLAACVTGTHGRIDFEGPFLRPTAIVLTRRDGAEWRFDLGVENGFQYEAAEFASCLAEGRAQSELMPLDGSVAVVETLDEIRAQIGLSHPWETSPGTPRGSSPPPVVSGQRERGPE